MRHDFLTLFQLTSLFPFSCFPAKALRTFSDLYHRTALVRFFMGDGSFIRFSFFDSSKGWIMVNFVIVLLLSIH